MRGEAIAVLFSVWQTRISPVRVLVAQLEAPRLELVEGRAAVRLAVGVARRHPRLDVVLSAPGPGRGRRCRRRRRGRGVRAPAAPPRRCRAARRADCSDAADRRADDDLLDLVELVDAVEARRVLAVGAGLAAEAGAPRHHPAAAARPLQDLAPVVAGQRHLRGADEDQLVASRLDRPARGRSGSSRCRSSPAR